MLSRFMIATTLAVSCATLSLSVPSAFAKSTDCKALVADANKDGSISLDEAKTAATGLFDRLDKDKDSNVTTKELQGRLSKKELAAADKDNNSKLTKDEYLAVVEARYKAADTANAGKLDCKALDSKAGKELVRVIK